ncbi:transcriptional regulator, TetR family [Actinacidiphila yanglinensis]|uniref:Transcriptional regulator, TetR family n=1 Tax=Actinacidiphila yanglinensis TaxID=310779 RepID=A0A1H6E368_9ACTN|nr:transcriptional regulator, TetR family [Actinacidiphila yanglinensis]
MTAEPEPSLRRADARRNHERVFAAALEVFQEFGLHGTMPQVAERAGVGKATVYRSYPAKEDLVEAVVAERLGELDRRTAPALAGTDPYERFRAYVSCLFESLAGDRLLSEALATGQFRRASGLLSRLSGLMDDAKGPGQVREDATALDLRVLLCGMTLQLMTNGDRDPALWRRYGELTLQALRP